MYINKCKVHNRKARRCCFCRNYSFLTKTHFGLLFRIMTWSIHHLSLHLPTEVWKNCFDISIASYCLLAITLVALSYSVIHQVLTKYSESYRQLKDNQQLIAVQHALQFLMLTILIVPFTYLTLSLNFEQSNFEVFKKKIKDVTILCITIILMYVIEIALRYRDIRPLVLVHHLCAIANTIFPFLCPTTANIKAALLLTYFITYEFMLFAGLLMYRLYPLHKVTSYVISSGIIIFGMSRVLQLLWIFASLIASWQDLVKWHAWIQIFMTILFSTIQMYSLKIHLDLRRKCLEKQLEQKKKMRDTFRSLGDDSI